MEGPLRLSGSGNIFDAIAFLIPGFLVCQKVVPIDLVFLVLSGVVSNFPSGLIQVRQGSLLVFTDTVYELSGFHRRSDSLYGVHWSDE